MKKYKLPKLYKKDKSGKIRSFRIMCFTVGELAIMITRKRMEPNGKTTIDRYEYIHGKNLGRSNETTAWQQCKLEAKSMYNRLIDKGYTEDKNPQYREIPSPMLAIKWDESKIQFPCLVQPKLDGVRCIAYEQDGKVILISRRGKEFNIPHIQEFLEKNKKYLPLDGELYNHGDLTFQGIISAVKKVSKSTSSLGLVVYDKPILKVTNLVRNQLLEEMSKELHKKHPIKVLETYTAWNLEDVHKLHQKFIDQGYEGAIIRNCNGFYIYGYRSENLIKLKNFIDEEFEIKGIEQATGRDKGTAIFVMITKDGKPFKARPQGSKELRSRYWQERKKIVGKICTVKYQELSDEGIPRFPSAVSIRDYE